MRFRRFSLLSGGAAVLFALCCAFLAYEEGNGWLLWLAVVPLLAWRSGAISGLRAQTASSLRAEMKTRSREVREPSGLMPSVVVGERRSAIAQRPWEIVETAGPQGRPRAAGGGVCM